MGRGDHIQLLDSRDVGLEILIVLFVRTWSSLILNVEIHVFGYHEKWGRKHVCWLFAM